MFYRINLKITNSVVVVKALLTLAFCASISVNQALGAQSMGCLIEPQQVAEVGTPVIGVIDEILVERGDYVTKGQVMAVLHDDVEIAAVNVAKSRVRNDADEQAEISNVAFAQQKYERGKDLLLKEYISQQALEQLKTEYEVAEQRLAQVREQRRLSRRELVLAAAQLEQRSIRSPFDGVVAERYLSIGERAEDKPLFRVVQVDPLKVLVVVPATYYGRIQTDATATVQPQLPNTAALTARITRVDKLIDAPSNTFRVQLELPNPDLKLPAGLRCQTDFGLDKPQTKAMESITVTPQTTPMQPAQRSGHAVPPRLIRRSTVYSQ